MYELTGYVRVCMFVYELTGYVRVCRLHTSVQVMYERGIKSVDVCSVLLQNIMLLKSEVSELTRSPFFHLCIH